MTLRDSIEAVLGWCPRFETHLTRSALLPVTNLDSLGRVVIAIIIASWGLFNTLLYLGMPGVFNMLPYALYSPSATVLAVLTVLSAASGITAIILIADYVVTQRVLKRHRHELTIALLSQALYWLLTPLNVISPYLAGVPIDQVRIQFVNYIVSCIPQALLFGYFAFRISKGRGILDANSFLLMFLALVSQFIPMIISWSLIGGSRDLVGWMNTSLFMLAYFVGAIFCLRAYLKTRGETAHDLALPLYARAAIFIYGITHSGIFSYLATGEAKYLLFISGNTGMTAYAPYFVFFLGLMIASFMPINLRVSESELAPEA